MNTKMFLQLLVALGFVGISFACSCQPMTPEERFCTGNFAAIIFVRGGGQDVIDGERSYDICIIRTLRGNVNIRQADQKHLKTNSESSLCGITLEANKYYIISGHASDGKPLTTAICKFKIKFDSAVEARRYQAPTCP